MATVEEIAAKGSDDPYADVQVLASEVVNLKASTASPAGAGEGQRSKRRFQLTLVQMIVLWLGIGLMAVMGAFPPWVSTFNSPVVKSQTAGGYEFIGTPPLPRNSDPRYGVQVDSSRLGIQWACVAVFTGGMMWTLKARKQ